MHLKANIISFLTHTNFFSTINSFNTIAVGSSPPEVRRQKFGDRKWDLFFNTILIRKYGIRRTSGADYGKSIYHTKLIKCALES